MYTQESVLVDDFINILPTSNFADAGKIRYAKEFDYRSGRTDVIILTENGDVVAFEAKLEKWRDALHQAYKNTCFAHYSYVLLPEHIALRAAQYDIEFKNRAVGLCYLSNGHLVIVQGAPKNEPLQKWLLNRAIEQLEGKDGPRRDRSN